ncbi:titin [Drosophila guanche]|uniref:titin n=1 Tax=Drosophila guanche TaxID=7266 RepID=UPI00147110FB|nr:titin [Drosophila guanche]
MGIYEDTLVKVVEHMLDQKNIEVQDESVKRWMARQMGDKLSQIGTMTSIWASHAGRSQPGYFDVERTFKSMNITAGDLAAEVKANEGKPMPKIDFPVPETRVHHTPAKPLLGATSAKEMVKHPNVPSFLPPFPGPHTYKSTPMVPNNKIDYVESREKMALKRRQEKDNLNHLYKRMKQTVSLFSEPTGRFDLLDLEPPKRPAYMDALMPRDQTYEIDIYGDNDPIPEQAPKNPFLMPPKPPGTPKTPFPIDLGLIYNEYKGPLTTGMMIESTDSPKTSESAEDLSKAEEIVVQINEHTNIKEQKPEAEFEQASTSGSEEKVLKISKKNKKQKKAKESKADLLWSATSEGLAIVDLNNIEPVPVLKVEETQEKENIGEQQLEAEFEQASTCGSEEKVLKRSKKNKKQKKAKESKADLLWSATSEDLNNIEPEHVLKVEETQEKEIIAEQQLEAEFEQASTSGSEEKVLKISKKNKKQKKAKESKADLLWSATSEDLNNLEPEPVDVEETQEKENIAEQQLEAEFEQASTCGSEEKVFKRSKKNKKQKKAKELKADLLWSATSEDLNNLEPEPVDASTCGSEEKVFKRSKKNKKQKKAKELKADLLWSATSEDLNNLEPEHVLKVEETQEKEIIAEQQLEAEFEQASTCGSEEKVLKRSKKNKKQKKAKESKADLLWSATSEDLNNLEPEPVDVEETQEKENIAEQQLEAEFEQASTCGSEEKVFKRSKKNKKQKKAKELKADLLWSATSEDLNNLEPEPEPVEVEETQEKENIAEQQLEAEFEQASTSGSEEKVLKISKKNKKQKKAKESKADLLWSATSEDLNNVEPEHVLKVEETQEKEIIAEQQLEAEFEHASTCGSEEKVLKRSKKNKKQKKAKESKADLLWSATSEDLNNLEPEPEPVEVEETQEKENIAEQQLEAEFEQASTCGSKEKVLKRSKKNKKQKKAKESKADLLWSATYEDLNNLEPEPMDVEETQEKEIIAEQQLEAEFEQASTCGSEEKVLKISKKNKKQKKAKESKADLLWSATSEDLNNIEPVPVLKVEETQERENIAEQQKKNKKQKKAKESKADLLWSATSEDLNNLEPEHVLKVEETQEKEIIAEQQLEAEFEQASTSGFGENLPQSSHSKKRRFMEDKKRDKREKKSRAEMFARLANEVSKDVENKENVPISVNKPLREGKKSKRNA